MAIYFRINGGARRLDWNDENGIEILPWPLENLGELQPGEIYGFVPAYSASGDYPVRNLQKLPLIEHLVMLAKLSAPTLYDYVQPEGGQGGFGALVPTGCSTSGDLFAPALTHAPAQGATGVVRFSPSMPGQVSTHAPAQGAP